MGSVYRGLCYFNRTTDSGRGIGSLGTSRGAHVLARTQESSKRKNRRRNDMTLLRKGKQVYRLRLWLEHMNMCPSSIAAQSIYTCVQTSS